MIRLFALSLLLVTGISAAIAAPEANTLQLSAKQNVADALNRARNAKARVTVVLRSGQSYTGFVGELGDHHVLISELTGKEFYDALVTLDAIEALEVRARAR